MAGEIASLFVKLGLDATSFTQGVKQAEATTTGFASNASKIGTVAKAGFLAAGAGLAVVTKAAAQAEDAQGKFMAATGGSRDEAKAFVSSMDSLAGSSGTVRMSFEQVAATGTEVARQFGLTGAEGAKTTEQFSEFAKVVGADSVAAVNAMDDTLDAFHEPASKATEVMDELVASNQKFGTEVGPDTITMLGKMAPALNTMGTSIDDGVALLNLMESSGLDTSAALKGIVAASQKMPDGMSLNDFLKHLQALKDQGIDPTSEAVKVFGNKAGVGLANSIVKGEHGLDGFRVSAQDAGGAVTKASDAMVTTGDRVKAFTEKMMAGAREIGQQFGPALTGAASAASLAAPFLKTFGNIGAPVAKAFGKSFSGALSKVVTIPANIGANLASKLVGPLATGVSTALSGVMDKVATNSALTGSMDKIGGMMGGRIGTALKGAAALALVGLAVEMLPALEAEWDKIRLKLEDIGHATAETTGKSTEEIIAAVANLHKVPESFDPLKRGIFELSAALPFALGDAKNTWGRSLSELEGELRNRGVDIDAALADYYANAAGTIDESSRLSPDAIERNTTAVTDAVDSSATDVGNAFDQYVTAFEDGSKQLVEQGDQLARYDPLGTGPNGGGSWITGRDFVDAAPEVQDAVQTWMDSQNAAITKGADDVATALEDMKTKITDKLSAVQDAFNLGVDTKKKKNVSGAKRLKDMADDIDTITKRLHESIAANDPVNTAYWESALIDATNKYNTAKNSIGVDANQIAADVAAATSSAGADMNQLGNKAGATATTINTAADNVNFQPAANNVDAAADDVRESMHLAGQAAQAVAPGIRDYVPVIGRAAQAAANAIRGPIDALDPHHWGVQLGNQLVAGMRVGNVTVSSQAAHWANLISNKLGFNSPAPREGALHRVPNWGPHMIDSWIGPMLRHGMVKVPRAAKKLADYFRTLEGARPVHHVVPPVPMGHHRRHRWDDAANPDTGRHHDTDTDAGVTINVTVKGNIYGTGGVKQLAADLETYMKRSRRGGARLVGAF